MPYNERDFANANISNIPACMMWVQSISTINRSYILPKKVLRIINFKEHNAHSSTTFHDSKIINITGKVKIDNCLFINNYTNNKLSSVFLLIRLHFHQCLTNMKHHLPLKEVSKSLVPKQHHMEKMLSLYGFKNLMLNTFSLAKVINFWILLEYVQNILKNLF